MENAETIQYLFRVAAAAGALQLGLVFVLNSRSKLNLLAGICCLGFVCYLIVPFSRTVWGLDWIHQFFIFMASSIPALLWLLAKHFFDDDARIPLAFWAAWGITLFLWLPNWASYQPQLPVSISKSVFYYLPQLMKLGFVLHAVFLAYRGGAADLVTQRLKLRVPIALGGSAVTAVVIIVEIGLGGPSPALIETVGSIAFFGISLLFSLYLLRLRPDLVLMRTTEPANTSAIVDQGEQPDPLIQRIRDCMNHERFYANHGATIKDLADTLAVPAYRLRPVINQHLGFRNFNQFLNHYRVEEATQRLAQEPNLPILTIALDVGFKSMSSFNTAFKQVHQQTPSAYRKSHP